MKPEIDLLAVRPDGVTFMQCLVAACETPELVRQFDRLYKANIVTHGSQLEKMIDKATGKSADDFKRFVEFVWEFVFLRLPPVQ